MEDNPARNTDRELEVLARLRFGALGKSEVRLLRAAVKGGEAVCVLDKENALECDPSGAMSWGADRHVRAGLIRWLCADPRARTRVDPGGIQLFGAKILGDLDLSFFDIPFGIQLLNCYLTQTVTFFTARVPALDLSNTWVQSLNAAWATVRGSVFLRNHFQSRGGVVLAGAQIDGDLDCSSATFINDTADALVAINTVVKGDVFLRDGFHSVGKVDLAGAQIGGSLDCTKAEFSPTVDKVVFSAARAIVRGSAFLRRGFRAKGTVSFVRARIGGDFDFRGATLSDALLDLRDAEAGSILDSEQTWRTNDGLRLDGFVYGRISEGAKEAKARLSWLQLDPTFNPQPYRQLAKILREGGDSDGARRVLLELEDRARANDSVAERVWDGLLKASIGYGYYPERAVWGLFGLSALGWILNRRSYLAGSITPCDKDAYESFKVDGRAPISYRAFSPLIYSLENSFPLVKFGQVDSWQPDPASNDRPVLKEPKKSTGRFSWLFTAIFHIRNFHASPRILRWFIWSQILLGWLFATLFVAGVAGLVRKE